MPADAAAVRTPTAPSNAATRGPRTGAGAATKREQ
jgi:hypothetical protein